MIDIIEKIEKIVPLLAIYPRWFQYIIAMWFIATACLIVAILLLHPNTRGSSDAATTKTSVLVSIANRSKAEISTEVIDALNLQLRDHFSPYWKIEPRVSLLTRDEEPGDLIVYVIDDGFPEVVKRLQDSMYPALPYRVANLHVAMELGQAWTVVLSRVIMQSVILTRVKKEKEGPSPTDLNKSVMYSYDVCSPVFSESYLVNGVMLSNFVLPSYFRDADELGKRTDYLDRHEIPLPQFGTNSGGFIRYIDPSNHSQHVRFVPSDNRVRKILNLLSRYPET